MTTEIISTDADLRTQILHVKGVILETAERYNSGLETDKVGYFRINMMMQMAALTKLNRQLTERGLDPADPFYGPDLR